MENPKVAIIIVNWDGWEDTIECLESLYRIDYPNYEIIIIDNHSQDDSVRRIKDYSEGKELTIIENEDNYGFAEGNNIGIRYALKYLKPKYILLLNNDTVVDKDFLKELISAGERIIILVSLALKSTIMTSQKLSGVLAVRYPGNLPVVYRLEPVK